MKVVLEPGLFGAPASRYPLALAGLFQLGMEGRHRIEVADDTAPEFVAWFDAASDWADDIELALAIGYEMEAREPSAVEVRVTAEATDWSADPPCVALGEAHAALVRPFAILLENSAADWHFLRCFCTRDQRKVLDAARAGGWLRVSHGGGSTLRQVVAERRASDPAAALRTWVLFDSDAQRPGVPSVDSEALRDDCAASPTLAHHQTERRAIENYIPLDTLRTWSQGATPREEGGWRHGVRNLRTRRWPIFSAFATLDGPQRHHLHMKGGFTKPSDEALYVELAGAVRRALAAGFETNREPPLSRVFGPDPLVTEASLRADGGWAELHPRVCALLAMLR